MAHAAFFSAESQRRRLQTAQLEKHLVEAQLQTLQRQLQPHFLFNTLHAISALMHRDVEAADVENAIKHAIASKSEGGTLHRAAVEG